MSKSVEDGELRNAQAFEAQIGAHIDYIPNDHVILRTGYRFGASVGDTDEPYKEHKLLTEQTLRKLLPGDLLLRRVPLRQRRLFVSLPESRDD